MNWQRFFRRPQTDQEQQRELDSYLDIATQEGVDRGLTPEAARAAARKKLGNLTHIREEVYHMNTLAHLEDLLRHLRFTLRTLAKRPGFAAVAILTLALGIGANTAVFSVVNAVLLRPLPYPHPEQLVNIIHTAPGSGVAAFSNGLELSGSMYATYSDENRTFSQIGAWFQRTVSVTGIGQPEQIDAIGLTQGTLEAYAVPPLLGRWFSDADQQPGAAPTVLLSHGYWTRRFGADRSVLGRTLLADGRALQIIGVMPAGFRINDLPAELLLPMQLDRSKLVLPGFGLNAVGRLKPGVSIEQASADITRMIPIWLRAWPWGNGVKAGSDAAFEVYSRWKITPDLKPLRDVVIGGVSDVLWVVMGTLAVVMLIVCANIANLLLVHIDGRRQELAVRMALGASRGRIVRELLLESAVLSAAGAVVGVGIARAGLALLMHLGPNLPRLTEISLDAEALLFTAAIAMIAALLLGVIPAWRYSAQQLSLRTESRTASASLERQRTRNMLVVVQVALALVLLIGSGLMIRTFDQLRHVNPGFRDAAQVQTLRLAIPGAILPEAERVVRMEQEIRDKLAALPGVTAVSYGSAVPMDNSPIDWDNIFAEGHPTEENQAPPMRLFRFTAPDFFHSMGTRVLAGRDYSWDDLYQRRPYAILSGNLARELWGTPENAVGKRIRPSPRAPWREVIGVVEDTSVNGLDRQAPATVYWPAFGFQPYGDAPLVTRYPVYVIHSARANTQSFVEEIRNAVWSVNSQLAIAGIETQKQLLDRSMARTSFTLVMLAIAGAMALVLGIVGIYGVIAYTIAQRRREIGIRLALGAAPGAVQAMFLRRGLRLTLIGLSAGLVTAAALSRLMGSLLFGVAPLDPLTFAVMPAVLLAAACAACYWPSRGATRIDPCETLRGE